MNLIAWRARELQRRRPSHTQTHEHTACEQRPMSLVLFDGRILPFHEATNSQLFSLLQRFLFVWFAFHSIAAAAASGTLWANSIQLISNSTSKSTRSSCSSCKSYMLRAFFFFFISISVWLFFWSHILMCCFAVVFLGKKNLLVTEKTSKTEKLTKRHFDPNNKNNWRKVVLSIQVIVVHVLNRKLTDFNFYLVSHLSAWQAQDKNRFVNLSCACGAVQKTGFYNRKWSEEKDFCHWTWISKSWIRKYRKCKCWNSTSKTM